MNDIEDNETVSLNARPRLANYVQDAASLHHPHHSLMSFYKDGRGGEFDIVDGIFDYQGDLPVTEAAKSLFEGLISIMGDYWVERSRAKQDTHAPVTHLEAIRLVLPMAELTLKLLSRAVFEADDDRISAKMVRRAIDGEIRAAQASEGAGA